MFRKGVLNLFGLLFVSLFLVGGFFFYFGLFDSITGQVTTSADSPELSDDSDFYVGDASTCEGSDSNSKYPNGLNYYENGNSTYNGLLKEDECLDENVLRERYCDDAGVRRRIDYDCSLEGTNWFCGKGACVDGGPSSEGEGSFENLAGQLSTYNDILVSGGSQYLVYGDDFNSDDSLLVQTALKRKELMKQAAVENPDLFLSSVLASSQRENLPLEVMMHVEEEKSLVGSLEVVIVDDFENEDKSKKEYYLESNSGSYQIISSAELPLESSGSRVNLNTYSLENIAVVLEGDENFNVELAPPIVSPLGEQKTLVILWDYPNSPGKSITPEQIKFDLEEGSIGQFYHEQSFNKTWISADVYGWYDLEKPFQINYSKGAKRYGALYKLVEQENIPIENYNRVVVLDPAPAVSWSTLGAGEHQIGDETHIFSFSRIELSPRNNPGTSEPNFLNTFQNVFAHEYGHALGLPHAGSLSCKEGNDFVRSLKGICAAKEYGSSYDLMGGSSKSFTQNAFYRYALGWIDGQTGLMITSSGNYSIHALEENFGSAGAIIFDKHSNAPIYSIEYRESKGFDTKIGDTSPEDTSGLLINRIIGTNNGEIPRSQILDLKHPFETLAPGTHALLPGEDPFIDETTGVTIKTQKVSGGMAEFEVLLEDPGCVRKIITLRDYVPYDFYNTGLVINSAQGESFSLKRHVHTENSYACPVATYDFLVELPAEWGVGNATWFKKEDSKKSFTPSIKIVVPENAPGGSYLIPYTIRDRDASWVFEDTFKLNIPYAPLGLGDLDGNGKILSSDALFALKLAVGQEVLGANEGLTDVNCDGKTTASDALLILRKSVGQEVEFCSSLPPSADLSASVVGEGKINPAFSGSVDNPSVVLTAEAAPGYEFTSWTGACSGSGDTCVVDLSDGSEHTIQAQFSNVELHDGGSTGSFDDSFDDGSGSGSGEESEEEGIVEKVKKSVRHAWGTFKDVGKKSGLFRWS